MMVAPWMPLLWLDGLATRLDGNMELTFRLMSIILALSGRKLQLSCTAM
jgi:hypothetical protein